MEAMTLQQQDRSRKFAVSGAVLTVLLYFTWLALGGLSKGHAADVPPVAAEETVSAVDESDHGGKEHSEKEHSAAADEKETHDGHADDHDHDAGIGKHGDEHGEEHAGHVSQAPAMYSVIPFVALLLCVALMPLFHKTEHWWEHNHNKFMLASILGVISLLYYALIYPDGVENHLEHGVSQPGIDAAVTVLKNGLLVEYIPFIALLFSLYVISGGVAIEGDFVGRPFFNTKVIAIGGLLASFIGTTGAAMLLIRPLLRANAKREYVAHTVVFFIFVVCNTGGCLLPIGDPPLFLGFLRGVPFTWTLSLWPEWLFMNILLIVTFFVWDTLRYRSENRETVEALPDQPEPFGVNGKLNFLWLIGVIFCVALLDPSKPVPGTEWSAPLYFREVTMVALAGLSLVLTSSAIRLRNSFNYEAILEVASLFVGIFVCMQAPIQILNVHGSELGIDQAWKFYWGTGSLSSFLDNAPTYVVFFETAKAMTAQGETVAGVGVLELSAISLGAVFMGAMTYIGNGPNFMVKAIAEKNNVRMPSFFGYMAYSCLVILPLSVLLTLVFFRG